MNDKVPGWVVLSLLGVGVFLGMAIEYKVRPMFSGFHKNSTPLEHPSGPKLDVVTEWVREDNPDQLHLLYWNPQSREKVHVGTYFKGTRTFFQTYSGGGLSTVADPIPRWAPPFPQEEGKK